VEGEIIMTVYVGLCAGGPNDGKNLASQERNVIIAIRPRMSITQMDPDPVRIEQGVYKYNEDVKMWIWQDKWDPEEL
jgi:hypothetical protein